jgi:hypothetical protein
MDVIQKLPQEAAGGQRKAPSKMLEENHCFSGLWRGHPLAAKRETPHEVFRRDHPPSTQQFNPLLDKGLPDLLSEPM